VTLTQETLTSQFAAQLQSVGSRFTLVSKLSEVRDYVGKLAEVVQAKRIAVSGHRLSSLLFPLGSPSPRFEVASQANMGREDFFSMLKIVEIGISVVDLAVAETGTLVTTTWDESERLVTALPKIHVALVSRSRLVSSLREAEAYVSEVLSQSGGGVTVSLISASSRTADIGDIVILGVHGPRDLHVLLIDEELPGD